MINYWIQKSDYSAEEFNNVTETDCLFAYEEFNWDDELVRFREDDNSLNCPAGLGIQLDGALLHICPIDSTSVFFNFHYLTDSKILGFIPYKRSAIHYVSEYPRKDVPSLIKAHINGEQEKIIVLK